MDNINPISCKERYESRYSYIPTPKFNGERVSVGEACTIDDYETLGFKGYNNDTRTTKESNKWAKETSLLATKSLAFYGLEFVFKLSSYLFKQLDDEDRLSTRIYFGAERLFGTFAGMFRNKIYGREDDNLGAEKEAEKHFGDKSTAGLSQLNNFLQTKARFLIPVIGLFKPSLANDIDCGVINVVDSAWWRNMSLNSGFYPGVVQDTLVKFKNFFTGNRDNAQENNLPSLGYLTRQAKEHWNSAMGCKQKSKEATGNEKNRFQLLYYKYMDQFTSVIMPFICLPSNLFGDTFRPIARRLGLEGLPRNITRVLSVADRSILGINYWFRFFKTEQLLEQKHNVPFKFRSSNLYLASLVGDVIDLPLTIFEDRIKESSGWIQHAIEVMRIVKDSSFNAFWAARRAKILYSGEGGGGDKKRIPNIPPEEFLGFKPGDQSGFDFRTTYKTTVPPKRAVPVGVES